MITIAMFAISLGISISVENPKNSVLEMLICFTLFGMAATMACL